MSAPLPFPSAPTPDSLVSALRALPPTARVLAKLQRMLMDPNSDLDDIAMLLKLDASLVTRIIHISNSILFRRGEACKNIEEAVNRVGFREIYRLVAVVAASSVVAGALPSYGMDTDQVWTESISCAIGAGLIADSLNEDESVAYIAGLLQGIGRLPIDQYLQSTDKTRVLTSAGFPLAHSHAEFALLAFTQADVAARMLVKWDFSPLVVDPVRSQYAPLSAGANNDRMACILYAARLLHTLNVSDGQADAAPDEEEILGELRLDRERLATFAPDLLTGLERARQITQSMR